MASSAIKHQPPCTRSCDSDYNLVPRSKGKELSILGKGTQRRARRDGTPRLRPGAYLYPLGFRPMISDPPRWSPKHSRFPRPSTPCNPLQSEDIFSSFPWCGPSQLAFMDAHDHHVDRGIMDHGIAY